MRASCHPRTAALAASPSTAGIASTTAGYYPARKAGASTLTLAITRAASWGGRSSRATRVRHAPSSDRPASGHVSSSVPAFSRTFLSSRAWLSTRRSKTCTTRAASPATASGSNCTRPGYAASRGPATEATNGCRSGSFGCGRTRWRDKSPNYYRPILASSARASTLDQLRLPAPLT